MQENDAVQKIYMSASDGDPRYISLGEHDSELLITTNLGNVLRRCLEGTGCNPQTRNSVMMQYGGSWLRGIGVLDETYIVADLGDRKIYECPLTSVGISKSNCEIFADRPQGPAWDPADVLVDPIKRLVFVADYTYSDVLVLDFDGTFLAPLASSRGALMQPRAIAQRTGLYAPLSPSHPPSSLPTAGERIEVALAMMDAYNSTVSNSHPTSAHDLALEVTATGYITGTNFTTTIAGEILYNKYSPAHASLTASVVIPYAGDWTLDVTQGTYNVQHFLGSPRLITVAPAATDPSSCTATVTANLEVGDFFSATISTFDVHGNPTADPSDVSDTLSYWINDDPAPTLLDGNTISAQVDVPGLQLLHVAVNGVEIGGSPFAFSVTGDLSCPPGYTPSGSRCERCGNGLIKSETSSAPCTVCGTLVTGSVDTDPVITPDSAASCICPTGFVLFQDECIPCPDGTECGRPGISVDTLPVEPGHWRSSNASMEVLQCDEDEACINNGTDVYLVLISFLLPTMTRLIFSTFPCLELDTGERWLLADKSIDCDSAAHAGMVVYAWIMVVVFCVGVPGGCFLLLWRQRDKINVAEDKRKKDKSLDSIRSLFENYKPEHWYWEPVEMTRRIFMTGFLVVLARGSFAQIVVCQG
ncbi:hypothetical protein TeGR_g11427, partial [Tetraparma gracilis]